MLGLAGYDTPRVMFPSGVARPWMLCRYGPEGLTVRALSSIPGSGMCKAGFTGYSAPRAVFLVLLSSSPDARHLGRYGPA